VRYVFDANCWRLYVDEKIDSQNAIGTAMFEPEDDRVKILFDSGLLMRQQYIALKAPYAEEVFNSWFEATVLKGVIDMIEIKGTSYLFAELTKLGVPKGEHVYFKVAINGKATFLVSLDTDLFDPKKKKIGAKEKLAVLKAANGPVCKHMKKNYSIAIRCPESLF
jgi:hypothetical protein